MSYNSYYVNLSIITVTENTGKHLRLLTSHIIRSHQSTPESIQYQGSKTFFNGKEVRGIRKSWGGVRYERGAHNVQQFLI